VKLARVPEEIEAVSRDIAVAGLHAPHRAG
jgi:hypothetical protein